MLTPSLTSLWMMPSKCFFKMQLWFSPSYKDNTGSLTRQTRRKKKAKITWHPVCTVTLTNSAMSNRYFSSLLCPQAKGKWGRFGLAQVLLACLCGWTIPWDTHGAGSQPCFRHPLWLGELRLVPAELWADWINSHKCQAVFCDLHLPNFWSLLPP